MLVSAKALKHVTVPEVPAGSWWWRPTSAADLHHDEASDAVGRQIVGRTAHSARHGDLGSIILFGRSGDGRGSTASRCNIAPMPARRRLPSGGPRTT